MPTLTEVQKAHPEFVWVEMFNKFFPNEPTLRGELGNERVFINKYNQGWFAERYVDSGGFVITDRPEEYEDWSKNAVYKREHPEDSDDNYEDDEKETPDGR